MSHNNPSKGDLWHLPPPESISGSRTLNRNSNAPVCHSKRNVPVESCESYDNSITTNSQSKICDTNNNRAAPHLSFHGATSSLVEGSPAAGFSTQDCAGDPRQTGIRQELAGNTQSRQMVNISSGYGYGYEYGSSIRGMGIPIPNLMNTDASLQQEAITRNVHAYRRGYPAAIPSYQGTITASMTEAHNYSHPGYYNNNIMASRPTQWASMMPLEHENRPSQLPNPGYLPSYPLNSPQHTFVPEMIPPNLQLCRIGNVMPTIYQGQEEGQIYGELSTRMHTNVGQSYNNCDSPRQQLPLEHFLPSPSQPQEASVAQHGLTHTKTTGKRKGRKGICFEERIRSLIGFRNEYGHCNVPTCTRKKDQLNKYYTLGLWCGNVRKAYKRIQQNKKPALRLTDEHIQRLCEVGFRWQRKRAGSPENANLE